MDLNTVWVFVAAVQAGSLSAAAARLEMALPTLSRHIRELEGDLKVRLFERGARGVRTTTKAACGSNYQFAVDAGSGHSICRGLNGQSSTC